MVKNVTAVAKKDVGRTVAAIRKHASLEMEPNAMMQMKCVAIIALLPRRTQSAGNPKVRVTPQNIALETLRHVPMTNTGTTEKSAQTTITQIMISSVSQGIALPGTFNAYSCWKTPPYESEETKLMSAEHVTMTDLVNCHVSIHQVVQHASLRLKTSWTARPVAVATANVSEVDASEAARSATVTAHSPRHGLSVTKQL